MNDKEKAALFKLLQRLVVATESIATTLAPVTGKARQVEGVMHTKCGRTGKDVSECGCKPSDIGLICAMLVSPSHENSPDVVCHKSAERLISSGKPGEGCCNDCLDEMVQGGDFDTREVDVLYPKVGGVSQMKMLERGEGMKVHAEPEARIATFSEPDEDPRIVGYPDWDTFHSRKGTR